MNKKDFIDQLAKELKYSKVETNNIYDAFFKLMEKSIIKLPNSKIGIKFARFGIFYLKERKAREGKNPRTGEKIKIKAQKVVTFKPAKNLKDLVNKK